MYKLNNKCEDKYTQRKNKTWNTEKNISYCISKWYHVLLCKQHLEYTIQ